MNYPLPSLQQFCLTRIGISLISTKRTQLMVIENLSFDDDDWEPIQFEVVSDIEELNLPSNLKKRLLPIAINVVNEIPRWCRNHNEGCVQSHLLLRGGFLANYVKRLQWTSMGNIDTLKMAHLYVQDENLNCEQRFNIACYFNITTEINNIWRHELRPLDFSTDNLSLYRRTQSLLVNYWVHCIEGELEAFNESILEYNDCTTMHKEVFLEVSRDGYEPAMEFFYDKLSEKHQKECVSRLIYNHHPYTYDLDLFNFLYKIFNREQMILFVRIHPKCFLHNLIRWQYLETFQNLVTFTIDVIKIRHYFAILVRNLICAANNKHDENYVRTFQFLWHQPESMHKRFIFKTHQRIAYFLRQVVSTRRSFLVRMVLINLMHRRELSFAQRIKAPALFRPIIYYEKWDLMEDYMTVFLPTFERAQMAYLEMDKYFLITGDSPGCKENWFNRGRKKFVQYIEELRQVEHCRQKTANLGTLREMIVM